MPALIYASSSQSHGHWTEGDLLSYWAACVERTGDDDADGRNLRAAVQDSSSTITKALEVSRELDKIDALLATWDERAPGGARDKAERRRRAAQTRQADLFAQILDAGLRRRVDLFLLGFDRTAHDWIAERCPTHYPDGIAVCERCARVFTPRRKRSAWRCENCHNSPHNALPLRWTNHGPADSFAGLRGEEWLRVKTCLGCGDLFTASRADQQFCRRSADDDRVEGDRCRKHVASGGQGPTCDLTDPLNAPEARAASQRGAELYMAGVLANAIESGALARARQHIAEHGFYDPPGYVYEEPPPRSKPCRDCGEVGPWLGLVGLARCGPCDGNVGP